MINIIDKMSDLIIKGLFEINRLFLILVVFLVSAFGVTNVNKIFLISILTLSLSIIMGSIILNKSNDDSKYRKVLSIIGVVIPVLFTTYFFNDENISYKVIMFLYFAFLWIKGIHMVSYSDDTSYFTKFIISLPLIFFIIITLGLNHFVWFKDNLGNYFMSYLIIWLILMARVNLNLAYSETRKNTINKKRNTLKFNIISIVLISIMVIFSNVLRFDFKFISKYFMKIINYVLYQIGNILYIIVDFLVRINIIKVENYNNLSSEMGKKNYLDESTEELIVSNQSVENIIQILKWLVVSIIIAITIFYIFKITKRNLNKKSSDYSEDEIKDFVLTKEDVLNKIKNPFIKLRSNLSKIFKDESRTNDLHIIRKLYISSIQKFISRGNKYNEHHTPNEYLNIIKDSEADKSEFDKLTDYYNKVRYGDKHIKKTDIIKAKEIDKSINELD